MMCTPLVVDHPKQYIFVGLLLDPMLEGIIPAGNRLDLLGQHPFFGDALQAPLGHGAVWGEPQRLLAGCIRLGKLPLGLIRSCQAYVSGDMGGIKRQTLLKQVRKRQAIV